MLPFELVHFGSGGFVAVTFVGVLACLEAMADGPFDVSGTSAGALLAFLIALGYDAQTLAGLLMDRTLRGCLGTSFLVWNPVERFEATGAMVDLTETWHLLDDLCRDRCGTGLDDLTFAGLRAHAVRNLYVIGTSLTSSKTVAFCADTHPNMLVRKALEISTCIPLVFAPMAHDGEMYVDGFVTEILDDLLERHKTLVVQIRRSPGAMLARPNANALMGLVHAFEAVYNAACNAQYDRAERRFARTCATLFVDPSTCRCQSLDVSDVTPDALFEAFACGHDAARAFFKKRA